MPQKNAQQPFWRRKNLAQMDRSEWESLCDSCGKCCLQKLEDEDSGEIFYTNIVCQLIDLESCRCSRYAERTRLVPECLELSTENIPNLHWMPDTCAYRLLAEGKDLPDWHPLVSGDPDSVHKAGVSVRAYAIVETDLLDEDALEEHIIHWQEQGEPHE